MQDLLVWKSQYNTGIEEIDLQHHYFLNLINRLSTELANSNDEVYRARLLSELNKYAQFHFLSEENIMYRLGYPSIPAHRKQHHELLGNIHVKTGMMAEGLITAEEILDFLTEWFVNHTVSQDQKIGVFSSQHGKER